MLTTYIYNGTSVQINNVTLSVKIGHGGYLVIDDEQSQFHGERVHRLVASIMIGKPLLSDQHVHHVNGNTLDNNPDNLQILTAQEHGRIHNPNRHNDTFICAQCKRIGLKHKAIGLCSWCYRNQGKPLPPRMRQ